MCVSVGGMVYVYVDVGVERTGGVMEELAQPDEAVPIKQTRKTNNALGEFTAQPFWKQWSDALHDRPGRRTILLFAREPVRDF